MNTEYFLRLGRITGKNGIEAAMKHNRREIQAELGADKRIDASRTKLNYSLHGEGNSRKIALRAREQILEAGIKKLRKNAVMAVEVLFSLPIDRHQQDTRPFFEDCLSWTQANMGGVLLAFDVHLDEAAPHAHALILPLTNGRMRGRDMIGNIGNLNKLLNIFSREVAEKHGLSIGSATSREQDKATSPQPGMKALPNEQLQDSTVHPVTHHVIDVTTSPYYNHERGLPQRSVKRKRKSLFQIIALSWLWRGIKRYIAN